MPEIETDVREEVGGVYGYGCVVGSGGGAVGEGPLDAACVYCFGFGERGEATFHGEGVGVQPVEEGGFAEDAGVGELGGMDMGVCSLYQWVFGR